jgi:outer membrane receptor protein involved in Fe transport
VKRFWYLTAALLWVLSARAAEILVTGRAVDENEAGIGGTQITIRNAAGQVARGTTEPSGAFNIRVPAEGHYVIDASSQGYFTVKDLAVDVRQGMPEVYVMMNHAKEVLQRVDVSATPEAVDVEHTESQRQLSGIQIMDVPYPSTHSLREAMTLMPGQVEDANGGLHFDGGRENQTNYLLDGFNVSDPLTGNLNTTVSVEAVQSLDYLSGRYSPEYGQGSAGTLDIKTETGDDKFRDSATNFVPGINTQQGFHLGAWTPRFNVSGPIVKGRAWYSDNLDADYNINVVPGLPSNQDTTTSLQASNLLHTQVNITPANILFTDFLFNYQRSTGFGLSVLNPPSTTLDQRGHTWFLALKDQVYVGGGTLLELGFAEMLNYARQIPQGIGTYIIMPNGTSGYNFVDSNQNSRRAQFLVNLFPRSWHLLGAHQLKMGIDVDRTDYIQDTSRTAYDLYGVSNNLLRSVHFAGSGVLSRPSLTASSYITDHWRFRKNLIFEAGLREDWDEILRRFEWSPRVSFSYAPFGLGNTRISGGYAVVYDPTIVQLFIRPMDQYTLSNIYTPTGSLLYSNALSLYTIPNERLKGPTFQNWSLGVDHEFPHRLRVSLSLLRKRGTNQLAYVNTLAAPIVAPANLAQAYGASYVQQIFTLTNNRQDQYDSAQVIVHHSIEGRYEWMASYTRSRAYSTEVLDPSLTQTLLLGPDNAGPLPWDSPNRFLSWGYLPTPFKKWAIAFLVEKRSGFPFSIQHDTGQLIGAPDTYRYPGYFNINLHVEWRFRFLKYRFAIRGGVNNLTNHNNWTVVNSTLESPQFLTFYGSDGRHFVARLRWLGKE